MSEGGLDTLLKRFVGMPASEFVLHRAPMLLLDTLVDIGADYASCQWCGTGSAFASEGGGVPSYIGIEYMAQCIAVHAGAHAKLRGRAPPLGFLLGTRHFRTSVSCFDAGRTFVSACREIVRDSQGMASFACELRSGATVLASANLAVFEQREKD
jgi:predicted hotdog family 3-hydroxylacyl-ACP dehydratase